MPAVSDAQRKFAWTKQGKKAFDKNWKDWAKTPGKLPTKKK